MQYQRDSIRIAYDILEEKHFSERVKQSHFRKEDSLLIVELKQDGVKVDSLQRVIKRDRSRYTQRTSSDLLYSIDSLYEAETN